MNLFDIVNGAEFNPKEIDYTQYDDLGVAIALSYYMCNAKYLTVINTALGEAALKRLEIKDRGLVSENPDDFGLLIGLVEDLMAKIRSKS
jgi:hypothetical protein